MAYTYYCGFAPLDNDFGQVTSVASFCRLRLTVCVRVDPDWMAGPEKKVRAYAISKGGAFAGLPVCGLLHGPVRGPRMQFEINQRLSACTMQFGKTSK